MGKLGQLLVARGWITVQQLTRAIQNQNVVGGRLGTCLIEMDALSEDNLLKGLSEQLGVPAVELDDLRMIPEEVRALVPEKLARRCRTIPFRVLGGRLDVAMMDPRNLSAQDEIAFASGKRLKVHVAHEVRVFEALEKYFNEEMPSRFGLLLDRLNRARYLWQGRKPDPAPKPEIEEDRRFATPRLVAPPPLPDLDLPPAPIRQRAPVAPTTPPPAAIPPSPLSPVTPPPAVRPAASVAAVAAAAAPAVRPQAPPHPAPPPQPAPAAVAPAPAPAAPPAPASPPPRPTSVSLTADELAALQGGKRRKRPLPSPESLAEAEETFQTAGDTEEVAEVLLGLLARTYRRAALFQVARDRVTAWMARGDDIDQESFSQFSIGFDQPSLFLNLRQGSGLYLGPLPPMPAHRELARAWGGELPRDCVMLPVRIKDRLVTVVYADGASKGLSGVDLPQLQRLTASTAAAFERCILHKKRGGEGKG